MDKNNKEYIVTKIEKYNEILDDEFSSESIVKFAINGICLIIFLVLSRINLSSLPENLDIVVNQILDDAFLFGVVITSSNFVATCIKDLYVSIMGIIWNNKLQKLQKNDIENQTEITIENKEGKTR